MSKEKKIAAAISAVMTYIRTEEDQATLHSMPPPPPAPATDSVRLWGISGRQIQMQTRMQMQMKAFHRFKN